MLLLLASSQYDIRSATILSQVGIWAGHVSCARWGPFESQHPRVVSYA